MNGNRNIRTSDMLRGSFLAAAKIGQSTDGGVPIPGAMTLTGASAAGLLLVLCGSVRAALDMCERLPMESCWPGAQQYLFRLLETERADTETPSVPAAQVTP